MTHENTINRISLKDSGVSEFVHDMFPVMDAADLEGKTVSLDTVVANAYTLYVEEAHVPDRTFELIVDTLDYMATPTPEGGKILGLSETMQFLESVYYMIRDGDISYLTQPRGLKVDRIVDIEEFVLSARYMNQRRYVRPPILRSLIEAFSNPAYTEFVLGGSIGWGKNYWADMAMAYVLYQLSCYHCPQIEYGLAPGTAIVFVIQSKTYALAKKVAFNQFGGKLRESPYFMKYYPFDPKATSELRFRNDVFVRPISSADTAALGMTVFGAMLDELNFMSRIQKSQRADGREYDQAERLYNTVQRRIKTRFHTFGKVPGKLILISSANQPDDFIEQKEREREAQLAERGVTDIYTVRMAHWEAYPPHKLSKQTFLVDIGDELRAPRLLSSMEEAIDSSTVLKVPMDYRKEFERDLEAAIRDIAGRPVSSSGTYFRQRDKLMAAITEHERIYNQKQLFTVPTVCLTEYRYHLDKLINEEFITMLPNNQSVFALHIDAAVSADGDHCGIGVSMLGGYKWVERTTNWDPFLKRYVKTEPAEYPILVVGGVLEVVPPQGDEIDLELVLEFVRLVVSRIRVKYVTADQYQSAQLLQGMRKQVNVFGETIKTGVISVDKDITAYAQFKQAMRDLRLYLPRHETLLREAMEVEFNIKKFKVDHPTGGSKDVLDAVVGSCFVAAIPEQKQQFKRLGEKRRAEQATKRRLLRATMRQPAVEQPVERPVSIVRNRRWYL